MLRYWEGVTHDSCISLKFSWEIFDFTCCHNILLLSFHLNSMTVSGLNMNSMINFYRGFIQSARCRRIEFIQLGGQNVEQILEKQWVLHCIKSHKKCLERQMSSAVTDGFSLRKLTDAQDHTTGLEPGMFCLWGTNHFFSNIIKHMSISSFCIWILLE